MSKAFALLFSGRSRPSLNSFADRLNCRYTVCTLSVIAVLAMTRVLVSEPIRCFTPSQFTTKQAEVAEQICWSSSTYYKRSREINRISENPTAYYQWIPLILALQAFLFYLPKLVWNFTSSVSGSVNVRNIVLSDIQSQQNNSTSDGAAQNTLYMSKCLGSHLVEFNTRWKLAPSTGRFWLLISGNLAFVFCIIVRLLYVANVLGQLFLLNRFLEREDQTGSYGLSALRELLSGGRWSTSPALPTSILCNFEVTIMGTVHLHTFVCSLPMSLWYEITFLFLWFWLLFVAIATILSLVCFVLSQFNIFYQERYCRLRLLAFGKVTEGQSYHVSQFVHNFLTRDAWFIVQNVGRISGDQKATELVCGLWENYIASRQEKEVVEIPSYSQSVL